MDIQTAIEIVEYHQSWRLGEKEEMLHEPRVLTDAINVLLAEVKRKWVNIKDQPLPLDVGILVTDGKEIACAINKSHSGYFKSSYLEAYNVFGDDYSLDIKKEEITHWMHLPELP